MSENDLLALARVRRLARSGAARSIRVGAGISLAELARAVGVGAPTVFRWERGERSPHGDAAIAYDAVLQSLLETAS